MTVRIAFPVLFGTLRLHLDKGRQWSVVEHLVLHALCQKPRTAAELAMEGNLPHRLVIEVVVRLMTAAGLNSSLPKSKSGFGRQRSGRTLSNKILSQLSRAV